MTTHKGLLVNLSAFEGSEESAAVFDAEDDAFWLDVEDEKSLLERKLGEVGDGVEESMPNKANVGPTFGSSSCVL